jgi:hypothetical protein
MSIDERKEQLLTLGQAARLLPTVNGKRIHTSTIWRWCSKGLHGCRLEHVRYGKRLFTSPEALRRFAGDLTDTSLLTPCSAGSQSAARTRLSVHASRYEDEARSAEIALDKEGI